LIDQLQSLEYEYRPDIRDRDGLERNFREKFQALNSSIGNHSKSAFWILDHHRRVGPRLGFGQTISKRPKATAILSEVRLYLQQKFILPFF
jgi:hypothetical protein